MEINGTEYVVGQDRNDEELVAHLIMEKVNE
ncbi:hypothetical protein LCGC14_0403670 [marine sediment metagenome]|uniref:Uncharacterized protein n=1 Tax=marine sediment metagenome TaxID=412755 RepID=A0A0F9T1T2_9ZZZZ